MKNIGKLAVLGAVIAASASFARADTLSVQGYFWDAAASNIITCPGSTGGTAGTCTGNQGVIPATPPSTSTATATFTLTNTSATSLFNFYLNAASNDSDLSKFLAFSGDGGVPADTGAPGTDNIENGLFEFTGVTTVNTGELLSISHDDGAELFLNGTCVICAGGPTSDELSTYTVTSLLAGTDTFELLYAEVNSAPAVLTADIGTLSTPEPSSLLLLGTGLLGAAGMLFRRRRVTV